MHFFKGKKDKMKIDCRSDACNAEKVEKAEADKEEGATVKILGSGCAKCNQLEANTLAALKLLGMDTAIEHVTDFTQIAGYGVMTTPALVVDGKVLAVGRALKTDEIVNLLQKVR